MPSGTLNPMAATLVLSDYIAEAMRGAVYEELEDGIVAGSIPECLGVIAFADDRRLCEIELRSVMEGWILLGLKWKDSLPVLAGIDLNEEPRVAALDAV